jgi:hypothetical protein
MLRTFYTALAGVASNRAVFSIQAMAFSHCRSYARLSIYRFFSRSFFLRMTRRTSIQSISTLTPDAIARVLAGPEEKRRQEPFFGAGF